MNILIFVFYVCFALDVLMFVCSLNVDTRRLVNAKLVYWFLNRFNERRVNWRADGNERKEVFCFLKRPSLRKLQIDIQIDQNLDYLFLLVNRT